MAIRLKIARSLSEISRPDDWKWNRWLKAPSHSTDDFTFHLVKISGRDTGQIYVSVPALDLYLFILPVAKVSMPPEFNRWLTKKSTKEKTSLISLQKSFRIFISKIQVEVSKNQVPKDQAPGMIYSYETKKAEISSLDFFEYRMPSIPLTDHIELKSPTLTSTRSIAYFIKVTDLSENLLDARVRPEILSYNKKYATTHIGDNLLIWKHENKLKCLKDQFIFEAYSITSNMLSTGENIYSRLYSFNIEAKDISPDLLSDVPETRNIDLLKPDEFKIESTTSFPTLLRSGIEAQNYFMVYDSSFIHYVGKKKILITSSKVISINFHKLEGSSTSTMTYILYNKEEHSIPFQELSSDYINHSYNPEIFENQTEEIEVKDNPVLNPRQAAYTSNKEVFDGLYLYQKEAIDFLMNNNKSILRYDPMLTYKPQALYSLSLLLRQGKVRCVLIVRSSSDIISPSVNKEDEWIAALKSWAPEIPYDIHITNTPGKLKPINFTTYESLNNLKLKRFDCIIMDKYSDEFKAVLDPITTSECQRVWILTTDLNSDIPLNYSSLSIKRAQVNEESPSRRYEFRWVQLDKKQALEYKSQLVQGQMKIYASIDRGEIYIIKPHLFTLLHQLLQTCNFASDEYASRKTDALLSDINSSPGKVIVLSQYEKYGLQRIEQILRSAGINFVSYRTGSAENEKSLNEFRTKVDIKVLLADVKAINSVLNTGIVSTLIHFDHWWNPVSQWQLEDRLINSNPVRIIQYCTENTIEEDIYKKLSERELTDKLIFESLTPTVYSEILTDEEWLQLYDIRTEEEFTKPLMMVDIQKKIKSFSLDELVTMVQRFISRIGYGKQKAMQHISEGALLFLSSRMVGKKEENVLVFIDMNYNIDQNSVGLFYEEYLKYKNVSKAYFISPGQISQNCTSLFNYQSHKITSLDGSRLGRLMHLFNLI